MYNVISHENLLTQLRNDKSFYIYRQYVYRERMTRADGSHVFLFHFFKCPINWTTEINSRRDREIHATSINKYVHTSRGDVCRLHRNRVNRILLSRRYYGLQRPGIF